MPRRWLLTVTLLALLGLAAPTVGAQFGEAGVGEATVEISITAPGGPVQTGTVHEHAANVRYSWDNGITEEPTVLRFEVEDEPDWVQTRFEPETIYVNNTTDQPSGIELFVVTLQLDIAPDAPAYTEATARYRVIAEENGMLQGDEDTAELTYEPSFRGGIDVRMPNGQNVTAWGGLQTRVPVDVTNHANGPVIVESTVILNPADALIQPPDPFQVEPQETRTVHLTVQVPWKVSINGDAAVQFHPSHMPRATQADTVETNFYLDGKSAIPVPGPGPLVALAGLLLATLATAHTRRP